MDSLIVAPLKINFHAPLNRVQRRAVSIMNPTDRPMIYKAKTNASRLYNVRPNCAKIMPMETIEIIVTYNVNETNLNFDPLEAKHKIIIQSIVEKPEMEGMANLMDAFRSNNGDLLLSNIRLEISFEMKPLTASDLVAAGDEYQVLANTLSQCSKEVDLVKQFEKQFIHESCLIKLDENKAAEMQQAKQSSLLWKCFGLVGTVLVAGAVYYFFKFSDEMENNIFY